MSSWTSRLTAGLVVTAIGSMALAAGLRRDTLECDRYADLCRISTEYFVYRRTDTVRISDIVAHLHEPGSRGQARIVLVDRAGTRHVVARAMASETRPRHAALGAFLEGDAPRLVISIGPWALALWAGVCALCIAPLAFYRGWR